jgi:hypothetical protein
MCGERGAEKEFEGIFQRTMSKMLYSGYYRKLSQLEILSCLTYNFIQTYSQVGIFLT